MGNVGDWSRVGSQPDLPPPFSDTICDLGGVGELANYGEYSGAPSEQQTYDYAKTILSLMTREKHPEGEEHHHTVVSQTSWGWVTRIRPEVKAGLRVGVGAGAHQTVKSSLNTTVLGVDRRPSQCNTSCLPPAGKVLIIGGSIANFTNVAATFKVRLHLKSLNF